MFRIDKSHPPDDSCTHSSTRSSLLVFPIDVPQSSDFLYTAQQLGFHIIAASSEPIDPVNFPQCTCVFLPYVTDESFDGAFIALLKEWQIDTVFAPHIAVWRHLRSLLNRFDLQISFRLCNESPIEMNWRTFDSAYRWAEKTLAAQPLLPKTVSPALTLSAYAGLYRLYNLIPGESDNTKLIALTQIVRQAPSGDVVEIGTLYGKSAFALAWLAKFHCIGSVITVDPWRFCKDQGEKAVLINEVSPDLDWKHTFQGFTASLAMFDNVNYLRHPSELAVEIYKEAAATGCIVSDEFGRTPIEGRIAILHIDGNHTYDSVWTDLETWLPFVQDGGWILFDDYQWAFGDGPKLVGDEFLAKHPVRASFVAADTLFVQV